LSDYYRVADFVADYISNELNLKHIFFVTGAGIMHLTDGLAKNKDITPIALHHEQSCSMASDAYSKVNNEFSVSMYSTGPAATNAITGLAGAWQDSVPTIFISGQVKKSESTFSMDLPKGVRQFGVQELNIAPIVKNITKYFVQVQDPKDIRYELEKATYLAKSGRPGPVWVEIPMDIQSARVDVTSLRKFTTTPNLTSTPAEQDWADSYAVSLRQSARPVIIAGRGVFLAGASKALRNFSLKYDIPVVSTYLGIDGMCTTDTSFAGKIGVKGDRAGNLAMQNSDLILALGSSLHVSVTGYEYGDFAREAKLVVVDIDPETHKKQTVKIHEFVNADVGDFISALERKVSDLGPSPWKEWNDTCQKWKESYPVDLDEYSNGPEINIYRFVSRLCFFAPKEAVFVSDAGSAYYAVSQGVQLSSENQRYVTSGAMATMGFTIPAAIGASFASGPQVQILAVTGDGSFQQNIQELQVIHQHALPIKLFVLNNQGYLSIKASQKNYFASREIGAGPDSGLTFPDTLEIAAAYGIQSERVEDLAELDEAISRALEWEGPYILEIATPPDQLIIPTVSSRIDAEGVMRSRPLEDMFPFLDKEELLANLFVDPV
jgi:acetolactate synthase-1/2/3 large subunit